MTAASPWHNKHSSRLRMFHVSNQIICLAVNPHWRLFTQQTPISDTAHVHWQLQTNKTQPNSHKVNSTFCQRSCRNELNIDGDWWRHNNTISLSSSSSRHSSPRPLAYKHNKWPLRFNSGQTTSPLLNISHFVTPHTSWRVCQALLWSEYNLMTVRFLSGINHT